MTKKTRDEILNMKPGEFWKLVRKGDWTGPTHDVCRGYAATDIFILPKQFAYDFLVFCHRNPLVCPVVDITDIGSPHPPFLAPEADLCTDLPKYRVYKNGQIADEPTDISKYWQDDLVAILLGEASSFHWLYEASGVSYRSLGTFSTNIPCNSYGPFFGNIAVSCKVFKSSQDASKAAQISARHPVFHGSPLHIGDPAAIGIKDLSQPDLIKRSDNAVPKSPEPGEIAMYWPCFGTLRKVAENARLPLTIVDYPLHNFVTEKLSEQLAVL
ncbi:D-glutamate cyclase family protein [Thermodesulfobacteriota bacterium]